jgi:WD40 repeat protein
MSLKTKIQDEFEQTWEGMLSDYVTAIAWSPQGKILAASSAAGEVVLYHSTEEQIAKYLVKYLQTSDGESINSLVFSKDGQFLAAGGQNGQVKIWRLQSDEAELITVLENNRTWVDRMVWSPTKNQLAFSCGRYVQVWDADTGYIETTLNFDTSSVQDITWHPNGESLAIAGYQSIKIWMAENWDDDPSPIQVDSTSLVILWSTDGKYIASGNMDRSITVLEWNDPNPWVMRGFPGKIRNLAWSNTPTKSGAPLLAASSVEGIVVWEKNADNWDSRVLPRHEGNVLSIQFQPNTHLLASASEDGSVCLWNQSKRLLQVLYGANNGFSCLSWHPHESKLAAGGKNGELIIWSKGSRGQGFGRR